MQMCRVVPQTKGGKLRSAFIKMVKLPFNGQSTSILKKIVIWFTLIYF